MFRLISLVTVFLLSVVLAPVVHAQEVKVGGMTANNVNLRDQPSTRGQIIAVIPVNTSIWLDGRNEESSWFFIQNYQGNSGWISAQHFTVTDGAIRLLPVVETTPSSNQNPVAVTEANTQTASSSDCPYQATNLGDGLVVINAPQDISSEQFHREFLFVVNHVENVKGKGNSSFRAVYVNSTQEAQTFKPSFTDQVAGMYTWIIYDGCHFIPPQLGTPGTEDSVLIVRNYQNENASLVTLHEACHWAGGVDGEWANKSYEENHWRVRRDISGLGDCHYWNPGGGTTPSGVHYTVEDGIIWQARHNRCQTDICREMRDFVGY